MVVGPGRGLRPAAPRQRLSCVGLLTVSLAGKQRKLLGFCHVGPGTLPTHYWLDEQQRLLFAIRVFRALILQSSVSEQEPEHDPARASPP